MASPLEKTAQVVLAIVCCITTGWAQTPTATPSSGCASAWTATSITNAPTARYGQTAVWVGSEMIVWGGMNFDPLNTGGRYSPITDTWTATNLTNRPTARSSHTAVWTGSVMIVWGGTGGSSWNTGGRYNPSTNSWTATSTTNAPTTRYGHTAIWTGSEMIVWGGIAPIVGTLNTGGRYNPSTDSWTAMSNTNAPTARVLHTAVWTGGEMIVWGGAAGSSSYLNTGGKYNPETDSWTATSITDAPAGRSYYAAVWTGREMIVWGGEGSGGFPMNTGGAYNPDTDSWIPTSTTNAPATREQHTAVWTGREMVVWGGASGLGLLDTGGRYSPDTDSWAPMRTTNAPDVRAGHTAVWTGGEMIVWGGVTTEFTELNSGGRYCAQPAPTPGSSPSPTPPPTPTASPTATATPTPTPTPRPATLGNISTRLQAGTADRVMIAGFIVQGSAPKRVFIRAAGPSLANFGVPNALPNPQLALNDSKNTIGTNDDWQTTQIGGVITSDQVAEIQSSGLAPSDSAESAIVATLQPGSYTAIVQGVRDGTGVGIVEVYDLGLTSSSLLANIATRGFVQTGDNAMIGGFIVLTQPTRVMVRAIGPSLSQFGVPDALSNPQLELHDASNTIAQNDDWEMTQIGGIITGDQVAEIQNSQLAPTNSAESAIIATLQPGSYTATVRGAAKTMGNALVEVYALP